MLNHPRTPASVFAVFVGDPKRFWGGVGGLLVIASAAIGFWYSPFSPAALDRPADLAASGQIEAAIAAYQDLAEGPAPDRVREAADWRAAHLAAVDTSGGPRAEGLLLHFVSAWPQSEHIAEAHARLAVLLESDRGRLDEAIVHLDAAREAEPDHADMGRWLLRSARLHLELDEPHAAAAAFAAATALPPQAASAWLGLGRLRIGDDPAAAYDAYQNALDVAQNAAEARLARLGMATALEGLEGREAALAEVDVALAEEGADAALMRRRDRLRKDR